MKDRIINLPGNRKEEFHKDEIYSISRRVKGIIKFIKYNFKHDITELRVMVK